MRQTSQPLKHRSNKKIQILINLLINVLYLLIYLDCVCMYFIAMILANPPFVLLVVGDAACLHKGGNSSPQ